MTTIKLPYTTYDVFTTTRFNGNPLAVVSIPASTQLTQTHRQSIAREFNYSETTFATKTDEPNTWTVGIFTPFEELNFAGHPTIGTICALADADPSLNNGTLHIKAGAIPFTIERGSSGAGSVRATAQMPHAVRVHAAGLPREFVQRTQPAVAAHFSAGTPEKFPVVSPAKGVTFALVQVPSRAALSAVSAASVGEPAAATTLDEDYAPSFVGLYFYWLEKTESAGARQVLHSRMIEKDIGEDAVTGAAGCAVSAYLALRAFETSGVEKTEVDITQGEDFGRAGRPGLVVQVGKSGVERMWLKGESVKMMKGELEI